MTEGAAAFGWESHNFLLQLRMTVAVLTEVVKCAASSHNDMSHEPWTECVVYPLIEPPPKPYIVPYIGLPPS